MFTEFVSPTEEKTCLYCKVRRWRTKKLQQVEEDATARTFASNCHQSMTSL